MQGGHIKKLGLLSWGICSLILAGCSGSAPQTSGIVAMTKFEAIACVGQDKILNIRNESTTEPQRVQGIFFEKGTNNDNYFKIVEVNANGQIKPVSGGIAEEILIPAGGVITVKVNYKPRKVTFGETYDATYLDVMLNGPKLGVMQIELQGRAPSMLEGCGSVAGDVQTFNVDKVVIHITDADVNGGTEATQNPETVTGKFEIAVEGDVATLTKDGFPGIPISTPSGDVTAYLEDETFQGTFDGSEINFDEVSIQVLDIVVTGKLTTGALDHASDQGSLSMQGSPLSDGTMVLVFAGTLPNNPLLEALQGGVIGAEIHLSSQ